MIIYPCPIVRSDGYCYCLDKYCPYSANLRSLTDIPPCEDLLIHLVNHSQQNNLGATVIKGVAGPAVNLQHQEEGFADTHTQLNLVSRVNNLDYKKNLKDFSVQRSSKELLSYLNPEGRL